MFKSFFKSKLNDSQKVEFEEILEIYLEDLKKFQQKDLEFWKRVQWVTFYFYFFVFPIQFLIHPILYSFVFTPILLNILSILINYKKEKNFLYNYNFGEYDSSQDIIKFLNFWIRLELFLDITIITSYGLVSTNHFTSWFIGYSPLTEFGMWTGLHKESPVSFWNKIKKD